MHLCGSIFHANADDSIAFLRALCVSLASFAVKSFTAKVAKKGAKVAKKSRKVREGSNWHSLFPMLKSKSRWISVMKVTDKDVAYVADLANLELTADERVRMVKDLNSILEHVDMLEKLDTSNVAPMAQVSDRYGVDESRQGSERFAYASRDDVVEGLRKSLPHDLAVQNAPDSDGVFFQVPKVIER